MLDYNDQTIAGSFQLIAPQIKHRTFKPIVIRLILILMFLFTIVIADFIGSGLGINTNKYTRIVEWHNYLWTIIAMFSSIFYAYNIVYDILVNRVRFRITDNYIYGPELLLGPISWNDVTALAIDEDSRYRPIMFRLRKKRRMLTALLPLSTSVYLPNGRYCELDVNFVSKIKTLAQEKNIDILYARELRQSARSR